MAAETDLGPLRIREHGDGWRVTLSTPDEVMLEIPSNFERALAKKLATMFPAKDKPTITMDLEQRLVLSSRQLGLMLALRKALTEYDTPLHLSGISNGVRELLDMTKTVQFFKLES